MDLGTWWARRDVAVVGTSHTELLRTLTKTKQNKNPTSLGALHVTGQGTEPEVKEFHFPRVTRYVCTHGRAYVCACI